MAFLRLVVKNLLRHPIRTLLTVGSLTIALFLMCTLRSLITTLSAGAEVASAHRVIVQSAVSLFVDLPLSYEAKVAATPGIDLISKWQWFGGYYQEERNQFSQFAVTPENFFEMYPELEVIEGSKEAFLANRRGCVIGEGLAERFGFALGDTIPLIPTIFPHPDGPDAPWEFEVCAIYRPTVRNFDAGVLFFQWDYFEKTVEAGDTNQVGVGTYVVHVADGADPTQVMADIDAQFENGPQRVQATTEAEFQSQFISMLGNIPFLLTAIGGAVFAAILLACVNTMLMSAREQLRDIGVLKALGFSDGWSALLLVSQALFLCLLGGGLGVLLAKALEPALAAGMGSFFPGYHVEPGTVVLGLTLTVGLGLFSGLFPAWRAARLRAIDALGATE